MGGVRGVRILKVPSKLMAELEETHPAEMETRSAAMKRRERTSCREM